MMKRRLRLRHRIGVPKGMLRHLTLKILEKQPMSGSELMDQIQGYTDWRPSPGSIYPLLAQLQEEKLIEPHPDEDPGLKRFKLAEEGVRLLEEHGHHDEQITKRHRTIHKMYWILHREMPEDLYESFLALMNAVEETYEKTAGSPVASERFKEILDEASRRLSGIGA
jgi:DNA-binding PadR family transcriptional regulator